MMNSPEYTALSIFQEMIYMDEFFKNPDKYHTFVTLQTELEAHQLLDQLNLEYDTIKPKRDLTCGSLTEI